MDSQTSDNRKVFVAVRTNESERQALHDAARAQGFSTLSEWTRCAWAAMLTGAVTITPQEQVQAS